MDNKEDVRTLFRILDTEVRSYLFSACVCVLISLLAYQTIQITYIVGSHMLCCYVLIIRIKRLHAQILY
jgi:hypothetical protein